MRKTFLLFAGASLFSFALVGCQGSKPMDAAQMQAKADSLYNIQSLTVKESMTSDCNAGMAGKVKMMCDSICNANGMDMTKM